MYSFKKEERLCNVKLIEKLFTEGSSFLVYPFRIVWLSEVNASSYPVQVLISVPKKRFKRAVDRNLIKRRIREVYRLNKLEHLFPLLLNESGGLILGITYIGKEVGEYAFLEKKFKDVLVKLKKLFQNSHVEKDI
jgi:ribonuclease P protein component